MMQTSDWIILALLVANVLVTASFCCRLRANRRHERLVVRVLREEAAAQEATIPHVDRDTAMRAIGACAAFKTAAAMVERELVGIKPERSQL